MKYTKERVDKLINLLVLGTPIKYACAVVGIDERTYHYWIKKHPDFRSRAEAVEGEFIARNLAVIEKAARGNLQTNKDGKQVGKPGDWKAAAWMLEKRVPKAYGYMAKLQMENEALRVVMDKTSLDEVTPAQIEKIVKQYTKDESNRKKSNK